MWVSLFSRRCWREAARPGWVIRRPPFPQSRNLSRSHSRSRTLPLSRLRHPCPRRPKWSFARRHSPDRSVRRWPGPEAQRPTARSSSAFDILDLPFTPRALASL